MSSYANVDNHARWKTVCLTTVCSATVPPEVGFQFTIRRSGHFPGNAALSFSVPFHVTLVCWKDARPSCVNPVTGSIAGFFRSVVTAHSPARASLCGFAQRGAVLSSSYCRENTHPQTHVKTTVMNSPTRSGCWE